MLSHAVLYIATGLYEVKLWMIMKRIIEIDAYTGSRCLHDSRFISNFRHLRN